jgi:signal transduction histidine kinase
VGTRGAGLGVLQPGQQAFTWFDGAKGLVDQRVMHLLATGEGRGSTLWVATQGGLQRFLTAPPGPTEQILTQASSPSLPGNLVYTVQRGLDGSLYAFTSRGVARLSPQPRGGLRCQTFTTGDGLPSNGCVQGASLVDARGRVWAGTVLGLAVLDPSPGLEDDQPKPLVLEGAWNGDRELAPGGPWELPWRSRQWRVSFSLLSYHREADSRFRSQLVGLEAEPGPWGPAGEREYLSLPAGHYTLRIWGRDHAGNESGPLELPLRVQAQPWLRWWAVLGYVLLLTGGMVGLILWRVNHLEGRNLELEHEVAAATTEVRRHNETLARTNRHLARLNEEKNHMLGIAAHDLRNPLSAIGIYAESLAELSGNAAQAEPARRIQKLTGEMSRLIERLLNSSRIDAGQLAMRMEGVNAWALLEGVAERHLGAAQAKGLELVVEAPEEGLPPLLADPLHLMEALDNLVGNAIKFTPPGPPIRQVLLRARPGMIEVKDEGPGFSEEDKAHAFEPFRRLSARPTAGEGSTGLGLYIVKALVEAMGGEIELQSEPGQGTTLRIHLGRA